MAYATPAEFGGDQGYLKQVDITDADTLQLVSDILDRATDIVDKYLKFSFGAYGAAATKKVRAGYSSYFSLPAHQIGSVTTVVDPAGTTLEYWEELESGKLLAVDTDTGGEWSWRNYRYDVTAVWGYGPAPDSIVEVTLELAVNIWRSKDSGHFTRVVGASDGAAAIGYEGELTPQQKMILDKVIASYKRPRLIV